MSLSKALCLIAVVISALYANAEEFIDNDLDGVDDRVDKCLDSLLTDIVDESGCAIEQLSFNEALYDFSLGFTYTKEQDKNSLSNTFSFSYFYKNFSYTLTGFLSEDGFDDLKVSIGYQYKKQHQITLGGYIPLQNTQGDKTDYFIEYNYDYSLENIDFSISWRYTLMQDDESKNSNKITLSAGYLLATKWYGSLSYSYESSLYQDSTSTHILSLGLEYTLSENSYISSEFSYGLNKTSLDCAYSFSLGYSF